VITTRQLTNIRTRHFILIQTLSSWLSSWNQEITLMAHIKYTHKIKSSQKQFSTGSYRDHSGAVAIWSDAYHRFFLKKKNCNSSWRRDNRTHSLNMEKMKSLITSHWPFYAHWTNSVCTIVVCAQEVIYSVLSGSLYRPDLSSVKLTVIFWSGGGIYLDTAAGNITPRF